MPLDFRPTDADEGFTIKRFLKTFGLGVGVFLFFLAVGYYGLGPRIQVSEEGRIRFVVRQDNPSADTESTSETTNPKQAPMPKVEVYEKLPSDVVAGTGVIIGSREVAPFNYDEYQRRRAERKQKPKETETAEVPLSSDEDYFVPDEPEPSPEEPAPPSTPESPDPASVPAEPPSPEPKPTTEPEPVTPKSSDTASGSLYRVQIGVYESRENANSVAQSVRSSGFEATIVPFQRDGRTLYRVQSLVTRDRAKAEQLKQQLESRGFPAVITTTN